MSQRKNHGIQGFSLAHFIASFALLQWIVSLFKLHLSIQIIIMEKIIRLINILLAALLTGIIFGIWIGTDPQRLSEYTYVEQQQNIIKSLNVLMPIIGAITILLTIISAVRQKQNQTVYITLLAAAGLFIITGLITRFGNQPLNAIVMAWDKKNIPANWTEIRDKWWLLHKIRTVTSFIALILVIWSSIRKD